MCVLFLSCLLFNVNSFYIVVVFLGPTGFKKANPQSGTPQEVYPMHINSYYEEIFRQQWEQEAVENTILMNFLNVSTL